MAERTGLERALVTPEGVTLRLQLGSVGVRAGAFMLDTLIQLAVLVAMTLLLVLAAWASGRNFASAILVLWLLGSFVLRNFYFVLLESGGRAATLGKRVFKLRVIARDGSRLTGAAVVARNLMREIEFFLPLSFLGAGAAQGFVDRWTVLLGFGWTLLFLLFPLFNRDRLRAGDLIAGTWVVENERRKIGADLLDRAAEAGGGYDFTPAELAVYGQFELQRLEEVLRRGDADAITTVAAVVARKLGRPHPRDERDFIENYYATLRQTLERKLLLGHRKRDKHDILP